MNTKGNENQILQQSQQFIHHMHNEYGINPVQSTSQVEPGGKFISIDGTRAIDCTRLDYLGLGSMEVIKKFMIESIQEYDVSCSASQAIFTPGIIRELEQQLAKWHRLNHSLIFTSGFAANVNIIQALAQGIDTPHILAYTRRMPFRKERKSVPVLFFAERNCHYSILQTIRTCSITHPKRCKAIVFTGAHSLKGKLDESYAEYGHDAVRIILSDTIESSTGKIYDIKSLYDLAEAYDALLYLDEAHAVGAVGPTGAGVAETQLSGCDMSRVIIMGTLTKACSQLGGYVSFYDEELANAMRLLALQYIGSAPVPAWMAATLIRIIDFLKSDHGNQKRQYLQRLAKYFCAQLTKQGFSVVSEDSQIVSITIGQEADCLAMKDQIAAMGFLTAAFVYPSAPKGEAMLRVSICADLAETEIYQMTRALKKAAEWLNLDLTQDLTRSSVKHSNHEHQQTEGSF